MGAQKGARARVAAQLQRREGTDRGGSTAEYAAAPTGAAADANGAGGKWVAGRLRGQGAQGGAAPTRFDGALRNLKRTGWVGGALSLHKLVLADRHQTALPPGTSLGPAAALSAHLPLTARRNLGVVGKRGGAKGERGSRERLHVATCTAAALSRGKLVSGRVLRQDMKGQAV